MTSRWLCVDRVRLARAGVSAGYGEDPAGSIAERMAPLHLRKAQSYTLAIAAAPATPLRLETTPVFRWQNLLHEGSQLGDLFIWTDRGRPEAIATVFSQAEGERRLIVHEFHTLSDRPLQVAAPVMCRTAGSRESCRWCRWRMRRPSPLGRRLGCGR